MARPIKTGLNYFPLPVNEFDDEKYLAIRGEYGSVGELALIKLQCILYEKGYYLHWIPIVRAKLLAQISNELNKDQMDALINSAIEYGFFNADVFKEHDILTSKKIQANWLYAVKRRSQVPKLQDREYWLLQEGEGMEGDYMGEQNGAKKR